MNEDFTIEYKEWVENEKRELWKNVAVSVAGSSNVTDQYKCAEWADYIVAEYENRFLKES